MYLRRIAFISAAAVLAMAMGPRDAAAVNSCTITGNPGPLLIDAGHPYYTEAACPGGTPCGCTVSGTNCQFRLAGNVSTSSTSTCLTLGSGVTFDLSGHSMTCTGSDCGIAIANGSSSGSSNKVLIENGSIYGCFDAGVYINGGTDSTVTNMQVDLGASCTNGINTGTSGYMTVGIFAPRGLITYARVHHTGIGAWLSSYTGKDIEDSVLSDNDHGLIASGTYNAVDNVLFANNGVHIWNFSGAANPDISGSSFIGATTCNCTDSSDSCESSLTACGTFQAPPSHICDPSDTSDPCTIQ